MANVAVRESERPLARNDDWRCRAACAKVNPEMFSPPFGPNGVRIAKAFCRRCPVRMDCLQAALALKEAFGIWGGLTEGERRQMLRRRKNTA